MMFTASALNSFHDWFSYVLIVGNGMVGAWALAAHWLHKLRHRSIWWLTASFQASILVQAITGAVLLRGDGVEIQGLHTFYGFIALASVGIIYSYRQIKQRYLLYGLGGLFIMGLSIRAVFLGGEPESAASFIGLALGG